MKRIVWLSVFLSLVLVSASFGATLLTGLPLGQGKIAGFAGYASDSNVGGASGIGMAQILAGGGYGITSQLDLLAFGGVANASGLPTGVTISGTGYVGGVRYNLMNEMKGSQASVAVLGLYNFSAIKTEITGLGASTANGNKGSIGVIVSKLMIPFVPYAVLTYGSSSSNGAAASTQFDITIGTTFLWSMQGAILVEYTAQSITPNGGTGYSSPQLAACVAYIFN